MIPKKTEEKLAKVKTNANKETHLQPDFESCKKCKGRGCMYVCPADVYSWDEKNNTLIVKYENCLECGACKIACDMQTLKWEYPKSDYGITYKNS